MPGRLKVTRIGNFPRQSDSRCLLFVVLDPSSIIRTGLCQIEPLTVHLLTTGRAAWCRSAWCRLCFLSKVVFIKLALDLPIIYYSSELVRYAELR